MSDICSLCLGGETDVPPFGTLRDAQDLIKPCSTCSLVVHKKCLFDWFNSLPSDKFHVFEPHTLHEGLNTSRENRTSTADIDMGASPDTTRIDINLSPDRISQWLHSFSSGLRTNPAVASNYYSGSKDPNIVLLLAPCPQCREDIAFSMRRSPFLASTTSVKTMITRGIQYSGVFLAFTSAITGVVSMGYIGLTSCGLKIMDSMLPGPLLVQLLTKSHQNTSYSKLSQILLGNTNYSIDNLEQALSKGLIDPFKFSRIPVLPIILYRMRTSSVISCFFDNTSKENTFSKWITEIMINGYISSLGNHELFGKLYRNCLSSITNMIRNPSNFRLWGNIFYDIDFFKVNNLISMLIPIRAIYDLFFRLTINRYYFDLTVNSRPREIANTVGEEQLSNLETINSQITGIEMLFQRYQNQIENEVGSVSWFSFLVKKQKLLAKLLKNNTIFRYLQLRLVLHLTKIGTCIRHDYSAVFMKDSFTMRCFTTVIWPFISSKAGKLIFEVFNKLSGNSELKSPENTLLICNIIGLVGVVFIKDIVNLYLSYKKANQLTQMSVIRLDKSATMPDNNLTDVEDDTFLGEIPGGFQH